MPTLAQGAGQSIESAFEIFNLLKNDKLDKENNILKLDQKGQKLLEVDQILISSHSLFKQNNAEYKKSIFEVLVKRKFL